ncbi:MAG TPA: GntR family transcriptional regulator [Planctomycetota bacterium]|nr:GntR family transcriptional regulator [Planctomycetota bacterium]
MIRVRPLKRAQTLKDMAYDQVKLLLRAGKMSGDSIYSANQLADSLGVSRTPVREALLQLSAEGLLKPIGSKGFRMRRYSRREINDTFEARKAIECWVVEQLAGNRGCDLKKLAAAFDAMADAAAKANVNAFMLADERFHLELVHAQGNSVLAGVMENVRDRISVLGYQVLSIEGRMAEVLGEHRRILEALQHNDPARARQSMANHLDTTQQQLTKNLSFAESDDADHADSI